VYNAHPYFYKNNLVKKVRVIVEVLWYIYHMCTCGKSHIHMWYITYRWTDLDTVKHSNVKCSHGWWTLQLTPLSPLCALLAEYKTRTSATSTDPSTTHWQCSYLLSNKSHFHGNSLLQNPQTCTTILTATTHLFSRTTWESMQQNNKLFRISRGTTLVGGLDQW